mgnify:CR=1 FL=1
MVNYLAINIGDKFGSPLRDVADIGGLVSTIISVALTLAGIIVLTLFVLGGIGIIAAAGSDNPEGAAKGKQAVTSALIGFIIVFAAYWIIQIIENLTGITILNVPF